MDLNRRHLLAVAILMLALVTQASVVVSVEPSAATSGPATLSTYLGTQAAAAYDRATRLADEMRLLYQITRLEELKLEPAGATTVASPTRVILCKEAALGEQARKSRS